MRTMFLLFMGLALCAGLFTIQAGPPLICHPYDIGNAQSLPWGHSQQGTWEAGWDNPLPGYDTKQLTGDTLKILDAPAPVLVRMETMRRAALYGANDHASAAALLAALKQRATAANPGAPALFDYGYFTETLKQIEWKYKEDLTGSADGYQFVERALAMEPNSPEMHFAAAIIARSARKPDFAEHARKARAAEGDALLAANIRSHLE
jgi:hypothetical protein